MFLKHSKLTLEFFLLPRDCSYSLLLYLVVNLFSKLVCSCFLIILLIARCFSVNKYSLTFLHGVWCHCTHAPSVALTRATHYISTRGYLSRSTACGVSCDFVCSFSSCFILSISTTGDVDVCVLDVIQGSQVLDKVCHVFTILRTELL